jgi:ParB family chromosome partitioning protein
MAIGGKRRSLLANAIESLSAPAPAAIPAETETDERSEDVLAGEELEAAATHPSFLARRAQSLGEVSRVVKRPTIKLKPSECSIWPGNARNYADLNYERCESLINSIKEEGRNREAVVVRRTSEGPLQYELLVGTRRHWCVSWLHANNHSDVEFIARIETLDDEGAFRLADLENREREDVTDLERARNYLHAVEAYYGGVRSRMAERLAIPQTSLYNFIRLGELSDDIIAAFPDTASVKAAHANKLAPHWKIEIERERIIAEATAIVAEQAEHRANGEKPIEASKVCDRLIAAAKDKKAKPKSAEGKSPSPLLKRRRPAGPCGGGFSKERDDHHDQPFGAAQRR